MKKLFFEFRDFKKFGNHCFRLDIFKARKIVIETLKNLIIKILENPFTKKNQLN